jgi:hypothetical protein
MAVPSTSAEGTWAVWIEEQRKPFRQCKSAFNAITTEALSGPTAKVMQYQCGF